MKKKVLALVMCTCAIALSAFLLAGCSSNSTQDSSSSNSSSTKTSDATSTNSDITKLIVGFDQAYPPYGFVGDDGQFTGFDLDLAAEVASRNGWIFNLSLLIGMLKTRF